MKHPLLRPSWLIRHTFTLLIGVMMIGLGFWQLDRLDQRRASNATRQAVLTQNPVMLPADAAAALALVGQRVRASGSYLNDQSMILRARRSNSGVEGVHLLTPFKLAGSDQVLIIDRGWLPTEQAPPEARAAFAVEREITVEGVALAAEPRPDAPLAAMDLALPGENRIDAWVRVDIDKMQAQIDAPLLPIYVELLPAPDSPILPVPVDPRRLDEGPHLGYALQWFTFTIILVIVYTALIRQELKQGKR
jgi:surfeit locus 1 family protein